jgi:hypothetical protein
MPFVAIPFVGGSERLPRLAVSQPHFVGAFFVG